MKKLFKNKKIFITSLTFLLIVLAAVPLSFAVSAKELVDVYNYENPELTMANIANKDSQWTPSGTLKEQSNGNYVMSTNSWAFWLENDSLDMAYLKTPFNTGRGSILTVETTLTEWKGSGSASAGICIRNSLDANAVGIYLCQRPGEIYFMYRKSTGVSVNQGIKVELNDTYPTSFRITVNKTKNNATGYYKQGDGKWVTVGNIPFTTANTLYSGIAAHSVDKSNFIDMKCSGFSAKLQAPEGYTVDDDDSSSGSGSSSEPEIKLPEDLPVTGDVLLRETFTSGTLFPAEDKQGVANPLWTVEQGEPKIGIDDAQTNRYLSLNAADNPLVMIAGDMNWTDYSTQVEIMFPSADITKYEENIFSLLVRHKSVVIGGSMDYSVTLINKFKSNDLIGQYLQLNYSPSRKTFAPGAGYVTLKEVQLANGDMIAPDVTHTIRVDTFDNKIDVYFDGEHLISWDDTDRQNVSADSSAIFKETQYPNLVGCVGFYTKSISAVVDNLVVTKLNDPIGGDYDNQIGGMFDEPIPDYIRERYDRK